MLINNAYCFCPETVIDKIDQAEFFYELILQSTIHSNHHVLLDLEGELWLEYLRRTEGNVTKYTNLETWKMLLNKQNGKVLKVNNMKKHESIDSGFITDLTIKAVATCKKYIVTSDNNSYSSYVKDLKLNGIDLLSEFNILESKNTEVYKQEYCPFLFYNDLILALSKVSGSRINKLENEYNDNLRDLLEMKGYEVYDQHRMGVSETGLSVGNLDLIIKSRDHWVTIIEPLRLASIDRSNILKHYNKLIDNYNSLRLSNTHLVIYYTGKESNFVQFYKKYFSLIKSLTNSDFKSEMKFNSIEERETPYGAVKSFVQQGEINETSFNCSHICICFT